MRAIKDIGWVAGLLEGEGYFGLNKGTPRIYVNQTDKDTVEKLRDIMSPDSKIGFQARDKTRQNIYRFWLYGTPAVSWMMTIYCMMSARRKKDIKEIIHFWQSEHGAREFKMAEVYAAHFGITIKEALPLARKLLEKKISE